MSGMPRKAPIDAPAALHHIILRGINRRKIFSMILIGTIFWTGWVVSGPTARLPVLHGH
jgi:hypothetical protein